MEFSEYCPAATHYLHTTVTDRLTTTTDYLTQLHTTETDCLTTTTDYLTQLHTTETDCLRHYNDRLFYTVPHTETDCLTHYTPPRQISWQNIIAAGDLIRKCAVKVLKPLLYQSFPFIPQFVGGGDAIAGLCLVIYYLDRVVARQPLHTREMWEPLPG